MSLGPKERLNSSFMSHEAGWESLKKTCGDEEQKLQRADTSALVNRDPLYLWCPCTFLAVLNRSADGEEALGVSLHYLIKNTSDRENQLWSGSR